MSSPRYPSLKSSSSTSWQNLNKIPESYPHRPYNSWRSAQCAGRIFLMIISLNYLSPQLSYLDLKEQRLRDLDLILSQSMKEQLLHVRFLSYHLLLLLLLFYADMAVEKHFFFFEKRVLNLFNSSILSNFV